MIEHLWDIKILHYLEHTGVICYITFAPSLSMYVRTRMFFASCHRKHKMDLALKTMISGGRDLVRGHNDLPDKV